MADKAVNIWIPDGYMEMPLTDINERLSLAQGLFDEMPSYEMRTLADSLVPFAAFLLNLLADRDVRYCGIGRHLTPDGDPITSCITVCVHGSEGDKSNPRLILKNLIDSRNEFNDDLWMSEPVDVDGRPMIFSERVVELPAPQIAVVPTRGDTIKTYQLEAIVPAEDGTAIAAVELSTAFIDQGPNFRKMVFDMARSIVFLRSSNPSSRPSSLNL